MKLSRLSMVQRIVIERNALVRQLECLDKRDFCVTIDTNRQDDTIAELVRPVLYCEVSARISALDRDLVALGVELD